MVSIASISADSILSSGVSTRKRITDFWDVFKGIQGDVMEGLSDDSTDTIDFLQYTGLDKSGAAFQYAYYDWSGEMETAFTLLLDAWNFQSKLEDRLNSKL